MSSHEAFLSAIRETPDDDAPRLVYADWLEDNGDLARAEFIRAQCRLERMPEYDPERFELEERSLDLLAEHHARWLPKLPKWASDVEVSFHRGMPEAVWCSAALWRQHGAQLTDLLPLCRLELTTSDLDDEGEQGQQFASLLEAAEAANLTQFTFTGALIQREPFQSLARWRGLTGLTGLGIRYTSCEREARELFASPRLAGLVSLDLISAYLAPESRTALTGNTTLASLRELNLSFHYDDEFETVGQIRDARWGSLHRCEFHLGGIPPEQLRLLLGSPWLAEIRSLCLRFQEVTAERLAAVTSASLRRTADLEIHAEAGEEDWLARLADSDVADRLVALTARNASHSGAMALAQSRRLGRLYRLHLGANGSLLGSAAAAVAESPHLTSLRELSISGVNRTPWIRFPSRPGLRSLSLAASGMTASDTVKLARSRHLHGVAHLAIEGDGGPGDRAITDLLAWAPLAALRELRLHNVGLGDEGVVAFARCSVLSRLRCLDLSRNAIGAAGAAALADSPFLERLLKLIVPGHFLHQAARERLRDRFGSAVRFFP